MKIISVVSAKGGVGKTTVTATLAHALARQGARVLVLDLDPQNALALHFGIHPNEQRGLSRATLAQQTLRSVVMESASGAFIVPYGIVNEDDRGRFERLVENRSDWLTNHIQSLGLPNDTLVLIDTPPGPSVYMKHALHCANLVVVVTIIGFGLLSNSTAVSADKLDIFGTVRKAATATVNGVDFGSIKSHFIDGNGLIKFGTSDVYATSISSNNVQDVFAYLNKNLTTAGDTVAFTGSVGSVSHTWVYASDGSSSTSNDFIVDLVGVTADGVTTLAANNASSKLVSIG